MTGSDTSLALSVIPRCTLGSLMLLLSLGCQEQAGPAEQQRFATPNSAVEALLAGIERNDQEALLDLFGHEHSEALVTTDWEANRETRETIAREGRTQHELLEIGEGTLELVIGSEEWPFPMLIVADGERWRFDTESGLQELVDRRVGRNELTAIEIMQAYVDAQIEYATRDRNGNGWLEYAQKLASTPGKRDGLYWEPGDDDEEPSPFGPLIASAERYLDTLEPGDPIRGYYFSILSGQGENAPGGARDYVVDGHMRTGFALVAYPAEHGNTGIMTFVVNHGGQVFEKDLGPFAGMEHFDPDETWSRVEE